MADARTQTEAITTSNPQQLYPHLTGIMAKRVLVVDDEPFIAETTVMVLKLKGYKAACAYSGVTALSLALTFRPDVAVLDVMMEGMNGIETSIALLEIFPNCSIVLVSGRQETAQLLQKELDKGNDIEVLAKPVHPQVLLDTIATLAHAQSQIPVAR